MMKTMLKHLVGAGVLLSVAAIAVAEGDPTKPDFEIPKTHIEVRVLPQEEVSGQDPVPEELREKEDAKTPKDPMEALRLEIQTVRDELRLLQATLDLLVNQVMADQRQENEYLRQEVFRLGQQHTEYGLSDPARVPRPGIGIIREVLEAQEQAAPETMTAGEGHMESFPGEPMLPPDVPEDAFQEDEEEGEPEPFSFSTVQEWGRSPEMVAEIGEGAASLKGIVGVVPPRSRREDIEQLGRDLRKQYEGYDNINIEVFDDEESAHQYAETQVGDSDHRVLSISRHAASGRDVILYLKKGEAVEVAP